MIDDSISTKTSTSGGRYDKQCDDTTSPRTAPTDPILAWGSHVDSSTGNTHWLACGPDDGKMWRLSPILMNMETWWTNNSDYPLNVVGQSWRYLDDAKRDIENRHRMIELYKRATDTAKKVNGEEKGSVAVDAGVKLSWRGLPNCNGWWVYWDCGDVRPHVSKVDEYDCIRFHDDRMWLGPIDDPHPMPANQM